MSGIAVPDNFSADHKLPSNYYNRFNVQENQYLLGNGVNFNNDDTSDRLGTKKKAFDTMMQKLGKIALTQGEAFGFYNMDHIDVFEFLEFVPLYDEEDGALKAGIRFWQIDDDKPLRATLYELDGYTEYIKHKSDKDLVVYKDKRPYVLKVRYSEADGMEIYDGENYPGFPIVPLWGNQDHVCKIRAWQPKIDCYDLIESGFANDVDDASLIYWTITNAGGMDDVDLAKFIQHMKTVKAAVVDDAAKAEAHTMDVPVQARETYLNRLEKDLYKDAMALDTEAIANGNTVATAIKAAYEPLNNKTDDFEYCVIEFIQGILELAGIDDDPTFKRSALINQAEETNMVLAAAQYLDDETIIKHLPFISPDEIEDILDNRVEEEADRFEDDLDEEEELLTEEELAEEGEEIESSSITDMISQLEELLGGL
jgi:SPP1 family phage portal protein